MAANVRNGSREREARGDKMLSVPAQWTEHRAYIMGMLTGAASYIRDPAMRDGGRPFRLGCMDGQWNMVPRAGLSSQLDRRVLAAVFVQHYVFTSMLSSHRSLRSLIMITFSVSFHPFEVLTSSFQSSNLLKNEISKLFFFSVNEIFKEPVKIFEHVSIHDRL